MKLDLPLPFLSAWDPRTASSGSVDPLGALRAFTAIATTILPGITTITSRVRYLSWVCAGLRLLDEVPDAPSGGRAGRARRKRILAWERLVALATGMYARAGEVAEDDPSWRQLRGVTYVRRAVSEGRRSPRFPMLRNQAGVGGVGTYWVTLVTGRLVEDDSGALTDRGIALAEAFLKHRATPNRARLRKVLRDEAVSFSESTLTEWGRAVHLDAASTGERRHLANALLEPEAHRRMASAMMAEDVTGSNSAGFRSMARYLGEQRDPTSDQLAAVLHVATGFEELHRELLYRFDQVCASGHQKPSPIEEIRLRAGTVPLSVLGQSLNATLVEHRANLPKAVARAVHAFAMAMEPALRADTDADLVRALVRHHEQVQAGKFDASRQPKRPWLECQGDTVVIAPRYALDEPPEPPESSGFTHPYRVEQFALMLREAGAWEAAS